MLVLSHTPPAGTVQEPEVREPALHTGLPPTHAIVPVPPQPPVPAEVHASPGLVPVPAGPLTSNTASQ